MEAFMTPQTELLTTQEVAARLGVLPVTLDKWRSTKKYKLAYTKIGGRVRYPAAAVEDFIRSRTITPGTIAADAPAGRARRKYTRRLRSGD
jgi:excisionase family DNA binding protein